MRKLDSIHHNYRGEKKMVNDLFSLADKEKTLAIDEDTRYYRMKQQFDTKKKNKQMLEKQVYK